MRTTDVSADRRQSLVKCDDFPHCHALVAPPTPRRLPEPVAVAADLARARQALDGLAPATRLLPNLDMVTRTLARREAVQSSQIEGTRTQLHELLEYEATRGTDGLPADALVTERYVEALDHGLAVLRLAGARDALDNRLLRALHAILMQDAPPRGRAGEYRADARIRPGSAPAASRTPASFPLRRV